MRRKRLVLAALATLLAACAPHPGAVSGDAVQPRLWIDQKQPLTHNQFRELLKGHRLDVQDLVASAFRAAGTEGHSVDENRAREAEAVADDTPSRARSTKVLGELTGVLVALDGVESEVAPYVPAPLRVVAGGDHAALLLDAISFYNVTVDGRPIPDFVRSELTVFTERGPGDTPAPVETYEVWFLSSHPKIVSELGAVGLGCRSQSTFLCRVRGLTLKTVGASGGPTTSIRSEVPWRFSPYTLSATFHSSGIEGVGIPDNRHWYAGARGLVAEFVTFSESASALGIGSVRADPATPLGRMLGVRTGVIDGPALALRTRFDATFTVWE